MGLTLAHELLENGYKNICILEKEDTLGVHSSGRNSGVLHAGIYYSADSLKAKFCHEGNQLMRKFCARNKITLKNCGKVIVAADEDELAVLMELFKRAQKNGARCKIINEKELSKTEPLARTHEKALYSYDTAVVNPKDVLTALEKKLLKSGQVVIQKGAKLLNVLPQEKKAVTSKGDIQYNLFINAAGTYSDRVAGFFGLGLEYKILPFKGLYKKYISSSGLTVNGNIYPVPNINNPFLGVHFTRSISDDVYVGPTAIPVFGRENYMGLQGFGFESLDILYRDAIMFFKSRDFRTNAYSEIKKYYGKYFYNSAKKLVNRLEPAELVSSNKVGIRAQLVNWQKKEMVMDFLVLDGESSIHIMNSVSPAFTSSMAFSKYLVKQYILKKEKINGRNKKQ